MERVILHSDLNNFFASVECLSHPELKEVPMAVCGSVEERHGIVLAKNPPARAMGVKTAEAVWQAKQKCPDLTIVAPHYDRYLDYSRRVRAVYGRFTDQAEPFGIDECWLDVTGSRLLFGSGREIAQKIQRAVKEELGLGVSVGVSFSKTLSKLGSGLCPPEGICLLPRETFAEQISDVPVTELLGVGPATAKTLSRSLGIFTIGQLARTPAGVLSGTLGKNGLSLWRAANGLERIPVLREAERDPVKSIGNSVTPGQDIASMEDAGRLLLFLCEHVAARLRGQGFYASSAFLGLRDSRLCWKEFSCRLPLPTCLSGTIYPALRELLQKNWNGREPLRSMGLRVGGLMGERESFQLSFFSDVRREKRAGRLEAAADRMRERFGEDAVTRASLLGEHAAVSGCSFHFSGG